MGTLGPVSVDAGVQEHVSLLCSVSVDVPGPVSVDIPAGPVNVELPTQVKNLAKKQQDLIKLIHFRKIPLDKICHAKS